MVGELDRPDPPSPWVGEHPAAGQGSSPHAWGMAGANKVLLDSLVAQRADGALIVGRGVPPPGWTGTPIAVTNFPTTDGRHIGLTITSAAPPSRSPCTEGRPAGRSCSKCPRSSATSPPRRPATSIRRRAR